MSYKRTCMLSNTPIYEGDKVKLFFLISGGIFSNFPVFSQPLFGSFDTSKILGGMSITAYFKSYDDYEVIEDIKSKYLLSLFKTDIDDAELSYKDIFKNVSEGNFKIKSTINEMAFVNIGLIHYDLYHEMVSYHKQEKIESFQNNFDKYLHYRDVEARSIYKDYTDEEYNKIKDKNGFEVNNIQLYTFKLLSHPGMNPFSDLKNINKLKDQEAFELFLDDMLMMDIFIHCGIALSPRPICESHSCDNLIRKLMLASHRFLYNHEGFFYKRDYEPKYNISVTQEIRLKEIQKIIDDEEILFELEKFIKKYQGIESITIKPESFSDIEWLSHFIEDEETTVIIYLN